MLVALTIWLLAKLGVEITPERIQELEAAFYGRPALVNVHFGKVFVPDRPDQVMFGIGFERHVGQQRYVAFGMLADVLLPRRRHSDELVDFMIAAQLYVHPVRSLELTYAFGAYWQATELQPFNRWGLGYRAMALQFAPVPSFWIDLVGKEPRYLLGAQLEF